MAFHIKIDGKKISIALLICTSVIGCHPVQYIGGPSSGTVLVVPSKSWYRPGTTGKETYEQRQMCGEESKKDPEFKRLLEESRKIHVGFTEGTKEQKRIILAPMQYQGSYIYQCLVSKGYKYGKVRPDQVYIPPPPPRSDWVKPGVSEHEESEIHLECVELKSFKMREIDKCMEERGFKWEVVDPHPSR